MLDQRASGTVQQRLLLAVMNPAHAYRLKGHTMKYTASIDEHNAVTLTLTHLNTTANIGVPDAERLGDNLTSILTDPDQGDIHRDGYGLEIKPDGVTVTVYPHSFNIPWRHLVNVITQLQTDTRESA